MSRFIRAAAAAIVMQAVAGLLAGAARAAEPPVVEPAPVADFKLIHAFQGGLKGGGLYTALVRGPDQALYGTTAYGGPAGGGTLFRLDPAAGTLTTVAAFGSALIGPMGPPLLGPDGNFYVIVAVGTAADAANLSRVTPDGAIVSLHEFPAVQYFGDASSGTEPVPGVTLGPDGALYGAVLTGGTGGAGAIYRMTLAGEYTLVHSFNHDDGAYPNGRLVLGADGLFYGTTQNGGRDDLGTLFSMDLQGNVTTLHQFHGGPDDGAQPVGPVMFSQDGRLYGTTLSGGSDGMGVVYRLSRREKVKVLHSFAADGVDGTQPVSGLVQASNGRFYGPTSTGGPLSGCDGQGCGTLYEIAADGRYHVVHQFDIGRDGQFPLESLFEASDGRLYGAAYGECGLPVPRCGALFSIRQR